MRASLSSPTGVALSALIAVSGVLTARSLAEEAAPKFSVRQWEQAGKADVVGVFVRQTADAVTIKPLAGAEVTLSKKSLSVDDLAYAKNVQDALEFRTWHFDKIPPDMADYSRSVRGAFAGVRCEDHQFSIATVELIDASYRRRFFPIKTLSDADQKLAWSMQAAIAAKRPAERTASYVAQSTTYPPGTPGVNTAESDHFVFYWGSDKGGTGKEVFTDPDFIPRQMKWFETIWDFYDRQMHAPMPYADKPQKFKLNVYIAGTGLERHKEGFAFGGPEILMHPAALGPGSSVVPHEFAHTIQFYTGGFRDSPFVGWFWECHANWSCHQFMPGYPGAFAVYFERQHFELNSSRMNYGSWPFLQVMAEDPRIGTAFCYDIWQDSLRTQTNMAKEDPFQAIMRLGAKKGFFSGNDVQGFGDVIGRLAAHNVDWDYAPQYFYKQVERDWQRNQPTINRTRVLLEPVHDRHGFYRPIFSHAPRQFGVNLIDLERSPSAKTVSVNFQGIVDEDEGSDWRVTLVAVDAKGQSRYSQTVRGGKLIMEVLPGDKRFALAVAATPTIYKPQEFRPGYGKKPRFPYEVSFEGCSPSAAPPQMPAPTMPGHRHPNGGGFVADSAKVDSTAYVGPDARVLDVARVTGRARIEDHAIVSQEALVSDNAVVGGYSRVMDRAVVKDNACVRDCAVVRERAVIGGDVRVLEYAAVVAEGVVQDRVLIKGFGEVFLNKDFPLGGGTILGEDLEARLNDYKSPISGGLIYGFSNGEFLAKDLADNKGLYAHWDFMSPRKSVLKDVFADNQGVLRGSPQFFKDGDRTVLALNGRDQYAMVEGQVADAAALTFDVRVKWAGGPKNQCLFDFGSDANGSMAFTPAGADGRAAFTISDGKQKVVLTAPALAVGKWTRVTVSVGTSAARLWIDGKPVVTVHGTKLTVTPDRLRVECGYLGRRFKGDGLFNGQIGDMAVYRCEMSEPPVATIKSP